MKYKLCETLAIGVLVSMAFAASTANAQTTGPAPHYPAPAWDQKLRCDTLATCPRFLVLSDWDNAAVLDRETGLVWERSRSNNLFNWVNAQARCSALATGGRLGWRLPTIQELASLVDPTVNSGLVPSLPPGHPFLADALYNDHWSATASLDPSHAWGVSFWRTGEGSTGVGPDFKTNTTYAWCVNNGVGQ